MSSDRGTTVRATLTWGKLGRGELAAALAALALTAGTAGCGNDNPPPSTATPAPSPSAAPLPSAPATTSPSPAPSTTSPSPAPSSSAEDGDEDGVSDSGETSKGSSTTSSSSSASTTSSTEPPAEAHTGSSQPADITCATFGSLGAGGQRDTLARIAKANPGSPLEKHPDAYVNDVRATCSQPGQEDTKVLAVLALDGTKYRAP